MCESINVVEILFVQFEAQNNVYRSIMANNLT